MNKTKIEQMFPNSVVTMETTDVFSVRLDGARFCNLRPLDIWTDDNGTEYLNVSYQVTVDGKYVMCEGRYALIRDDLEEQLKRLNAALIGAYCSLYGDETTAFSIDQQDTEALIAGLKEWGGPASAE